MINIKNAAQNYYENSFKTEGLKVRENILMKNYVDFLKKLFSIENHKRKKIRILNVRLSCGNLK